MTVNNGNHLICKNCKILLDCDWMGISIDYDDYCLKGGTHVQKQVACDCKRFVKANEGTFG